MLIFYFLVLLALGIFLEISLAKHAQKKLRYENYLNTALAEPGEPFLYKSFVSNYSRLPVLYCGLREQFQKEITVCEDEEWKKKHLYTGNFGSSTNYHFMLMPHKICVNKVHLSLPRRGVYNFGLYVLETGDFLGLKTKYHSEEINQTIVVMPKRAESAEMDRVLSGYLGEFTVRRFILEDPILSVGAREYTGREPMKSISWKQSARTGKLYVKQYDYTSEKSMGVVLNLEKATDQEIERCFEITRTVCEALEKQHILYDFYTNGRLVGPGGAINWLPEGLGRVHLNTILYAMGRSNGVCIESFERLLENCNRRRKNSKGYVIITPRVLPEHQEMLQKLRSKCGQEICILEGGEDA